MKKGDLSEQIPFDFFDVPRLSVVLETSWN
jgi:hypothetical protein